MLYLAQRRCSIHGNNYQGFQGEMSKLCTACVHRTYKDTHITDL